MIYLKTDEEISQMRIAGKISKEILNKAIDLCIPDKTSNEINLEIEKLMKGNNVEPWFKEVSHYPFASCISVNHVWLHGMPNNNKLKIGDVVSIDIGVKYNGFYVDNCWTVIVDDTKNKSAKRNKFEHELQYINDFLDVGVLALNDAIDQFVVGNRVGDIAYAMQKKVEDNGFSVIKNYTGHGVGYHPHEDPSISCYGVKGTGDLLKKRMVFAIEVMYAMGSSKNVVGRDGWTISSKDKKLTGMFEHTVALTDNGPEILTD